MGDFLFVVKCFVVTVVMVILMQIKIGPATIEQHSMDWMHGSSVVAGLQSVAAGAVKAMQQGFRKVGSLFDTSSSKVLGADRAPGSRLDSFRWRRSEAVERKEEAKRKERERQEEEASEQDAEADSGA